MKELNDRLKIYSEEVRDVLSDPPKTILKLGNTFLFIFIILLLLLSWFIKHPDIVSAPIEITTNIPPEIIIAKITGEIDAILVQDKAMVKENTQSLLFKIQLVIIYFFVKKTIGNSFKWD